MYGFQKTLIAALALVIAFGQFAYANPSNEDPDALLAIFGNSYGHEEVAELHAKATEHVQKLVEMIDQAKMLEESGNIKKMRVAALVEMFWRIEASKRIAVRLIAWREPAGYELNIRSLEMKSMFRRFNELWLKTPEGKKQANSIKRRKSQQQNANLRQIAAIEKLCSSSQWENAEQLLDKTLDNKTYAESILFHGDGFMAIKAKVSIGMGKIRSERAAARFAETQKSLTQDLTQLLTDIKAAAANVRTSGTSTVRGKPFTGPQLFNGFTFLWKTNQVNILRANAIESAIHTIKFSDQTFLPELDTQIKAGVPRVQGEKATAYGTSATELMNALAEIVKADADRVSAGEAESLYQEYLSVIAPAVLETHNYQLKELVQPALNALAAKSTQLSEQVAAYSASTDELLRWRRRAAAAQSRAIAGPELPVEQLVRAESAKFKRRSMFTVGAQLNTVPIMPPSLPTAIRELSSDFVGKSATVKDVFRVTATHGVGRFESGTYVSVSMDGVSIDATELSADLMVTDEAKPLSLESALAIESVKKPHVAVMGGKIVGFHVEGAITRFATLTPNGAILTPLGNLPNGSARSIIESLTIRVDFAPQWVQSDYYFARLSGN